METGKFAALRASLWNRMRLQLGAGLLIAVALPWLVRIEIA